MTIRPTEVTADDDLFPESIFTPAININDQPEVKDKSQDGSHDSVSMETESVPIAIDDDLDDNEFDGMSKVNSCLIFGRLHVDVAM